MEPQLIANELRFVIQAMPKGCYLVLCSAIETSGGEIRIPLDSLKRDALRLPPRTEVEVDGDELVIRTVQP